MRFAEIRNVGEARKILSEKLRHYLDNHDSINTVQELSNRTGISPSYTAALLRGEKTPSLEYLFLICNVLGAYVPEVITGLEAHIRPRGYKIKEETPEEVERYYRTVEAEWKRFLDKVDHGGHQEQSKSSSDITGIHDTSMYDKSMEAVGMPKGSIVTWKELDEEPIAGNVYIVRYNNKVIPRRLWFQDEKDDDVILIPCSTSLRYRIISVKRGDLDIIGMPIGVSYSFDQ